VDREVRAREHLAGVPGQHDEAFVARARTEQEGKGGREADGHDGAGRRAGTWRPRH
jgi:hypothetical protein